MVRCNAIVLVLAAILVAILVVVVVVAADVVGHDGCGVSVIVIGTMI